MKLSQLSIIALVVSGIVFTASCKKDDNNDDIVKKISAILEIGPERTDSIVFSYEGEKLIKTEEYIALSNTVGYLIEYGYIGDKLSTRTTYSYRDGGTKNNYDKDSISYDDKGRPAKIYNFTLGINSKFELLDYFTTIVYNSNNLPVKFEFESDRYNTIEYDGSGNAVKLICYEHGALVSTDTQQYDNKKNPFYGCVYYFGEIDYYSPNNPTKLTYGTGATNVTYEYDNAGYPTKITETWGTTAEDTYTQKIYYK